MKIKTCHHLDDIKALKKSTAYECSDCRKSGDSWVHLRTCQTCGVTLCCDSSVNKHASSHANLTGHAVVSSAEPAEKWLWCYKDEIFKRY